MRIQVTETPVYTYDELSDRAKERAREQWSESLWDSGSMQEDCEQIWEDFLTDLGWSELSDLTFALYSQGGYPEWSGRVWFDHNGASFRASVKRGRVEWVEAEDEDNSGSESDAEDELTNLIVAWSSELFYKFRDADEWAASDENVRLAAEANSYEYTEDGELA